MLEELRLDDTPRPLEYFSELVRACGDARAPGQVWRVLEEMERLGVPPDVGIYEDVITVLGKAGRVDDAFRAWKLQTVCTCCMCVCVSVCVCVCLL